MCEIFKSAKLFSKLSFQGELPEVPLVARSLYAPKDHQPTFPRVEAKPPELWVPGKQEPDTSKLSILTSVPVPVLSHCQGHSSTAGRERSRKSSKKRTARTARPRAQQ